jgi:cell wall-associated NlpC family hydrolase
MRPLSGYVGIPYADRGRDERTGLDCWGLLRLFYAEQFGIELPSHADRYDSSETREQTAALVRFETERAWHPFVAPRYGDAVAITVLGRPFHVGIVLDGARFLHTLNPAQGAVIDSLRSPQWARRIEGYYRHVSRTEH